MIYSTDKKYPNLALFDIPDGLTLGNNGLSNKKLAREGSINFPLKNNTFGFGILFNIKQMTVAIPFLRQGSGLDLFRIDYFLEKVLIIRFRNCIISLGVDLKLNTLNSIFISVENLIPSIYINGKKKEYLINRSVPDDFILSFESKVMEDTSQGNIEVEVFNITEVQSFKMKEFEVEKWHRLLTNGGIISNTCYLSNYILKQVNIPTFDSNYSLKPYNYTD